jgi:hypothetical protein
MLGRQAQQLDAAQHHVVEAQGHGDHLFLGVINEVNHRPFTRIRCINSIVTVVIHIARRERKLS